MPDPSTTGSCAPASPMRPPLAEGDPRHGTVNGYSNLSCRCPECRRAWAVNMAAQRDRRVARLAADPSVVAHGLASTYNNWGCRCPECTTANTKAGLLSRKGALRSHTPGHGTRTGYVKGCRCPGCVDAQRSYGRAYYRRTKNAGASSATRGEVGQ
jgi:hypothetical protein